jgi:hypothetical protein
MIRAVTTFTVALTLALAGVTVATIAQAQPPPPPGPCNFTLSAPQVVPVPGGSAVTATVTPAGCLGPFHPRYTVACVHIQGGEGRCAPARGPGTAQVFFEPYRPGTAYVSSGRGCSAVFADMTDRNCLMLGPFNATL